MLKTIPSLTPQDLIILDHLSKVGTLTRVEAEAIYKVRHIPGTIFRLRKNGHPITSRFLKDNTGQRYVRYTWNPKLNAKTPLLLSGSTL